MIRAFAIWILLLSPGLCGEILTESNVLAPEDLNINKWVFSQETDTETVAVMRIEHMIGGLVVEAYEEIHYSPDQPTLGSLLIFNSEKPILIKLPTSNTVRLEVDRHWQSLAESRSKVECLDGVMRPARRVEIECARETIHISFYSSPMEIFRAKLPKMPDPKVDNTSKFTWRHKIVDKPFWVSKSVSGDKETVTLHRKGEQDVTVQPTTAVKLDSKGDKKK